MCGPDSLRAVGKADLISGDDQCKKSLTPPSHQQSKPPSPELSRTTSSQLHAMDEFIESPDQEQWKKLVGCRPGTTVSLPSFPSSPRDTFRHPRRRRRSRPEASVAKQPQSIVIQDNAASTFESDRKEKNEPFPNEATESAMSRPSPSPRETIEGTSSSISKAVATSVRSARKIKDRARSLVSRKLLPSAPAVPGGRGKRGGTEEATPVLSYPDDDSVANDDGVAFFDPFSFETPEGPGDESDARDDAFSPSAIVPQRLFQEDWSNSDFKFASVKDNSGSQPVFIRRSADVSRHSRRRRRSRREASVAKRPLSIVTQDNPTSPFKCNLKERKKDIDMMKYCQDQMDESAQGPKSNVSAKEAANKMNREVHSESVPVTTHQHPTKVDEPGRVRNECTIESTKHQNSTNIYFKNIADNTNDWMTADVDRVLHNVERRRNSFISQLSTFLADVLCESEGTVCKSEKEIESSSDIDVHMHILKQLVGEKVSKVVCLDEVSDGLQQLKEENGDLFIPVAHSSVLCFINKMLGTSDAMEPPAEDEEMMVCLEDNDEEGSTAVNSLDDSLLNSPIKLLLGLCIVSRILRLL